MAAVRYASYEVCVTEGGVPSADLFRNADKVMAVKKTKSGIKEIDIKPLVKELEQTGNTFRMLLSAGSENNLKAELLMQEMYRLSELEYKRWFIIIERTELFAEEMIPLSKYQTVIYG